VAACKKDGWKLVHQYVDLDKREELRPDPVQADVQSNLIVD
jgi:hypothetical protein